MDRAYRSRNGRSEIAREIEMHAQISSLLSPFSSSTIKQFSLLLRFLRVLCPFCFKRYANRGTKGGYYRSFFFFSFSFSSLSSLFSLPSSNEARWTVTKVRKVRSRVTELSIEREIFDFLLGSIRGGGNGAQSNEQISRIEGRKLVFAILILE